MDFYFDCFTLHTVYSVISRHIIRFVWRGCWLLCGTLLCCFWPLCTIIWFCGLWRCAIVCHCPRGKHSNLAVWRQRGQCFDCECTERERKDPDLLPCNQRCCCQEVSKTCVSWRVSNNLLFIMYRPRLWQSCRRSLPFLLTWRSELERGRLVRFILSQYWCYLALYCTRVKSQYVRSVLHRLTHFPGPGSYRSAHVDGGKIFSSVWRSRGGM